MAARWMLSVFVRDWRERLFCEISQKICFMFDIVRVQSLLDRVEGAILLIQSKARLIKTPDDFFNIIQEELPVLLVTVRKMREELPGYVL